MSNDQAIRDQMRQLRERRAEKNAQNPRKRPRDDSSPVRSSDTENQFPSTPLPLSFAGNALVPRNVTSTVINYAKKQKLRGDQLTQVDTFLADTQTVRDAKLYVSLLSLQNDLQKIIATKPAYTVSPELKVNIKAYVAPVLLSPKLPAYKGDEPVGLVFNLVKKHRFDTPVGFEHNPADCGKIRSVIEEAFTQGRSKFKKLLSASVRIRRDKKFEMLPPEKHQNLYSLAQAFVNDTKCRINAGLVGRIALMVFMTHPDTDFWDQVDKRLAILREDADGDAEIIAETFDAYIDEDKEAHGNVEIVYQGTDDIQEEVDASIVAAGLIDATITVNAGDAGAAGTNGGDEEEGSAT
ncbi:hypothetical protein B0H14DRAFT_3716119 [Mycena olivaceomarginata]|nr:hypothetical protein B0H14DRAFT_3716119 [Mycena olivaceomarginata]